LRVLILIVAAVLAAFGGTLWAPFHFDDYGMLSDPAITSSGGWKSVWRFEQTRPLTYFTFWANYAAGGNSPMGYHAVNLMVHTLNSVLAWLCLSRLIARRAALCAALIFALHPIQTEAVAYIFARGTLLATMFCLGSFLAWIRGSHWLAVALFALGMLSKEECAAFPAFLALLHLGVSRNRAERPAIATMFAIAISLVARVAYAAAVIPGSGAGAQAGVAPVQYFLTQGWVILRYAQLLAVPVGFTVDPQIELIADWRGVACWLAICFAAMVSFRFFRKLGAGFWLIAGLLLILPTSSVFPAQDLAADRRVYLPLFCFATSAAQVFRRTEFPVLLIAGGFVLALLSTARTQIWSTEAALWEDAMRHAPGKLRPRVQLARASPPATAVRLLEESKNIAPDDPDLASELGRVYLMAGDASAALKEFGRTVALRPGDPMAINNRGVALMQLSLREPAIADFRRAVELDPCYFDARLNLRKAGILTEFPADCRLTDSQRRRWSP
jgi:hypothetical protein